MNISPEEKTTPKTRGTRAEIQIVARAMREQMTPDETTLWEAIRARRLGGLRFRSQHPVGQFVLDFYCPACKLAVEIDGDIHAAQTERDAARTALLDAYGYRVLRFRNDEVLSDLPRVLVQIAEAASEHNSCPPIIGG